MNTKKVTKRDPNNLDVPALPDVSKEETLAKTALRPTTQAAVTLQLYDKQFLGELDLMSLVDGLSTQVKATIDGDLGRAEAMLTAQAHTLDAIFNNLARRAISAEYLSQLEAYLKLSLRAQSQCRSTWEAVSAIQNPPITYVKQANIAQLQQVNNATPAGENKNSQNELLENQHGERLDTTTTGTTIEANPAMAALEEVNGSNKC